LGWLALCCHLVFDPKKNSYQIEYIKKIDKVNTKFNTKSLVGTKNPTQLRQEKYSIEHNWARKYENIIGNEHIQKDKHDKV
jgi:hypothetical protein